MVGSFSHLGSLICPPSREVVCSAVTSHTSISCAKDATERLGWLLSTALRYSLSHGGWARLQVQLLTSSRERGDCQVI